MAETYKRLGAVEPSATTDTSLYQVPASTEAIIDKCGVTVCNRSSADITFRIAHVDAAIASVADEDYVAYDERIPAKSSIEGRFLCGRAMATGHSILVYASAIDVSFTVGGVEIS